MSKTPQNHVSRTSLRFERNSLVPSGFEFGLPKQNSIIDKLLKDLVTRSDYVWPKTVSFEFLKKFTWQYFLADKLHSRKGKVIRKTIQGLVHTQSHSDQKYRYLACVGDLRVYIFISQMAHSSNIPDN